jgi:hypothetical protein
MDPPSSHGFSAIAVTIVEEPGTGERGMASSLHRKVEFVNEEGWYKDPFGRHEARWISDGRPTALVRDSGVESHDPPPDESTGREMERIPGTTPVEGDDLKRSDDAADQIFDPGAMVDAAEESIDSSG